MPPDRARVLAVAMPTTPGQIDLPGVLKEVSWITGLIQNHFVVQSLAGLTTEEVLAQLEQYDIVHFACHGSSNIFDPSDRCLLFQRRQPSKAEFTARGGLDRISVDVLNRGDQGHSPRQWISGGRIRPRD